MDDDRDVPQRHIRDMANSLREIRKRSGLTLEEVADRLNSTHATISRIESGKRGLDAKWISAFARLYGCTADEILHGPRTVPVKGYVGAGGEASFFETDQGPLDDAPAPPLIKTGTAAVEVRGDSMSGIAENQWLLYYDEQLDGVPDDFLGKLCIAWLGDGRVLVKKIYKGSSPGLFHLVSTSAALIEDVVILHSARVTFISPR